MKTISKRLVGAFLFLSILVSTTTLCAQGQIKASGKYVTKDIKVGNFDQIKLMGSPTVEYTQTAGAPKVMIKGSDNLVDLVECRVEGTMLVVSMKKNINISFGKEGRLKILASSPSLKSAVLQGSGDIYLGNLQAEVMDIMLSGSGDIVVGNVNCNGDFSAQLKGSGDIDVKGEIRAANVNLNLNGSGDLDVVGISGKDVSALLQGSGDIDLKGEIRATNINLNLKGSGDLSAVGVFGKEVSATLQGSGDLEVKNANVTSTVTAVLDGSGDMTLTGSAPNAVLTVYRSGELEAHKLDAQNVTARIDGSGEISCSASQTLKTDIKGSGEVSYKGNPTIQIAGKNHLNKL